MKPTANFFKSLFPRLSPLPQCYSASDYPCDETDSDVCAHYSPCEGVFESMADAEEAESEGEGQRPLRDDVGTGTDNLEQGEAASPPQDLDAAIATSLASAAGTPAADATTATAPPAAGPSVLPDPPKSLDLVCGISDVFCRIACRVARCCFEEEGGSPTQCRDDAQCVGYSPCSKFYVDS